MLKPHDWRNSVVHVFQITCLQSLAELVDVQQSMQSPLVTSSQCWSSLLVACSHQQYSLISFGSLCQSCQSLTVTAGRQQSTLELSLYSNQTSSSAILLETKDEQWILPPSRVLLENSIDCMSAAETALGQGNPQILRETTRSCSGCQRLVYTALDLHRVVETSSDCQSHVDAMIMILLKTMLDQQILLETK